MGQRQPQVLHVIGAQDPDRVNRGPLVGPVVVDQPRALRHAGGAGRIDEGGEVLRLEPGDAVGDRRGALGEQGAAALCELIHGQHTVPVSGSVERDDRPHIGQVRPGEFRDLIVVLREHHHGTGVAQDERDVILLRRRIDGGRRAAGAHHRQIGEDPFEPRRGCDRYPVLDLDAEREQPGGEFRCALTGLGPGEAAPAARRARIRRQERRAVGRGRDAVSEQPPERGRAVGQTGRGHGVLLDEG